MLGADADPDCAISDLEPPNPVHTVCRDDIKPLHGFGENLVGFLGRDRLVSLILERGNRFTIIVIAHPAFKGHASAGTIGDQSAFERLKVNELAADLKLR